jgi:hypothetical protein
VFLTKCSHSEKAALEERAFWMRLRLTELKFYNSIERNKPMPGHDLKALESELRSISESASQLAKIIFQKGYTTPREFTLVNTAAQAIAAQMKVLVTVSKEIVGQARA